jgi:transposase
MNYMGIDHHKQYSQMTLMDEHGKELKNERVWNFRSEVEKFLQGAGDEVKAVIEAGRSSYVMVDILEELGIDVKIANPKEVKAIAKAKIKTDKRDSRILAHLLRADLIPEVYQRSGENRRRQRVLRQRAFFVGTRTRVKNKIRVLLAQQKEEIQEEVSRVKNLFSRKGLEALKELDLPDTDRGLLEGLLKMHQQLEKRVKESDELVESLHNKMPEAQLISTVPGFGKFFSVMVGTEIADIGRFSRAEKLHSYAGVIPSTYSSAEKVYHGKIIKEGNKWLRWAAVEAVWPAVKSDFDLRLFFKKHAKRKNINAAKVATARRLLTIIYRILKEGRCYVPYKR